MSTLTFTATEPAVTVEFTGAGFLTETRIHHKRVADYLTEATGYLTEARRVLPTVPADFRTRGGADAATVVRLMVTDHDGVKIALESARRAVVDAEDAVRQGNVQHGAWAEHAAAGAVATAKYNTKMLARYLGYLPTATACGRQVCKHKPVHCGDCSSYAIDMGDLAEHFALNH